MKPTSDFLPLERGPAPLLPLQHASFLLLSNHVLKCPFYFSSAHPVYPGSRLQSSPAWLSLTHAPATLTHVHARTHTTLHYTTHWNAQPHRAWDYYLAFGGVWCVSCLSLQVSCDSWCPRLCARRSSLVPFCTIPWKVNHVLGVPWTLVGSDPIIARKLLSSLCMSEVLFINFLFACGILGRAIVWDCFQNFCLLSMVWVISCRQKKKKSNHLFPENILHNIITGNSHWHGFSWTVITDSHSPSFFWSQLYSPAAS